MGDKRAPRRGSHPGPSPEHSSQLDEQTGNSACASRYCVNGAAPERQYRHSTNDHRNLAGNLRSAHQNRMQRLMFTGNSTKRNRRPISPIDCYHCPFGFNQFFASETWLWDPAHAHAGRRSTSFTPRLPSTPASVMTEDFEGLCHLRYFASNRRRRVQLTK